jgi:hypothetical protein
MAAPIIPLPMMTTCDFAGNMDIVYLYIENPVLWTRSEFSGSVWRIAARV